MPLVAARSLLLLIVVGQPVRFMATERSAMLGWSLYLEGAPPEEARHLFEKGLREKDQESLAALGLGSLETVAGKPTSALEFYQRAFEGTLNDLEAWQSDPEARAFLQLLGAYLLHRMYDLREFRRDRPVFDRARLDSLTRREVDAELIHLYRYYLSLILIEEARFHEAAQARAPLRFAPQFLLLGPFDNVEESGLTTRFEPEYSLDFQATYRGRARQVSWRKVAPAPAWGVVDLSCLMDPSVQATAYLATALYAARSTSTELGLGHGGAAKVWIGSKPALSRDAYHEVGFDQVTFQADLDAGWTPIVIKICVEDQKWQAVVRLRSADREIRWWDGEGPFPISEPLALDKEAPEWLSPLEARVAPFADSRPLVRALALWLYANIRGLQNSYDEHEQENLDCYRTASEAFPNSSYLWLLRGLAEKEENAKRLAWERAVELEPRAVLPRLALAQEAMESDTPLRAVGLLNEAREINPDSPEAWRLSGRLLEDRKAEALAHLSYDRAARLAPFSVGIAHDLYRSREGRLTAGDCRDRLLEIQALNHRDQTVRKESIELALRQGLPSEAEALFRESLRVNPYAFDLLEPIVEHYRAIGNLDRSEVLVREALAVCPDSASWNRLLGLILIEKGDNEGAQQAWREALITRPQDAWLVEYSDYHAPEGEDYYEPYRVDVSTLEMPDNIPDAANACVLFDQEVRRVYENGSSSFVIHYVIRVLTDVGARENRTHRIYYEPDGERVRIRRARVTRPDGMFYDAPAPRDRSAVEGGGEGGRTFGDYHVLTLDLPNVEKGVTVDLEYEIEEIGENIYADYFGDLFYLGSYEPTALCQYVLIAPSARKIYHQVVGLDEALEEEESPDGSWRVYRWTYRNLPHIQQEPNMPPRGEMLPVLRVSTFETWENMTAWYHHLIRDQFMATDWVREKTREVISGYVSERKTENPEFEGHMLTDLDRVRAVNRFVNTRIRYLGLEFGIHGYKPHRAEEVLRTGYGDCKDKVLLAITMLSELGIEGRLALVRTRRLGTLDFSLPSLGLFNHAILYLPDVDGEPVILDGTAQFFGVNELPPGSQGVPLLTLGLDGTWEWVESPLDPPGKNGGIYDTQLVLREDGSADGTRRMDGRGLYNVIMRYQYENRGRIRELVEASFGREFPGTRAEDIQISNLDRYDTDEWLSFRLAIPRFAEREGEDRLVFRPVLLPTGVYRSYIQLEKRRHDLVLQDGSGYPWFRERQVKVRIPDRYEVTHLPRNVSFEGPFGSVEARWGVDGDQVSLHSRIYWPRVRIKAEEYPDFRDFCRRLDEAEEARVVLTRSESE